MRKNENSDYSLTLNSLSQSNTALGRKKANAAKKTNVANYKFGGVVAKTNRKKKEEEVNKNDDYKTSSFNEEDYLTSNLIAYIGNKRRLLPLLKCAIEEISSHGSTPLCFRGMFIDYFSGTGVVGRLAATLGFRVISNDWEDYASVLAKAFLCCDDSLLQGFMQYGGLEALLNKLNSASYKHRLDVQKTAHVKHGTAVKGSINTNKKIIATLYAPKTLHANPNEERMFYTPENGFLLDYIRAFIAEHYDEVLKKNAFQNIKNGEQAGANTKKNISILKKERNLLLALLLVQASKRSNTSGVFKAYHHGFGGRKKDALTRIMHKVQLEMPTLLPKEILQKNKVFKTDALRLAGKLSKMKAEIAYLDPPYNQHQYGSNYHILNTVTRWDEPHVDKNIGGTNRNKGGIREDWKKTKSQFCSKKTALDEFAMLVKKIQAKYLMISYSTEGMIDFELLVSVLQKKGRLAIVTAPYVRYRGGRQSNDTSKKNVEFVLIVDSALPCQKRDIENVHNVLVGAKLKSMLTENLPLLPISLSNYNFSNADKNFVNNINVSGSGISGSKKLYVLMRIIKSVRKSATYGVTYANSEDSTLVFSLLFTKKNNKHLKSAASGFCLYHHSTGKSIPLNARLQIEMGNITLTMKELSAMYGDLQDLFAKPNHEKIAGILNALFHCEKILDKKFLLSEAFRLAEKINAVKTPREYHAMLQWLQEYKQREHNKSLQPVIAVQEKIRSLELKMEELLVDRLLQRVFSLKNY